MRLLGLRDRRRDVLAVTHRTAERDVHRRGHHGRQRDPDAHEDGDADHGVVLAADRADEDGETEDDEHDGGHDGHGHVDAEGRQEPQRPGADQDEPEQHGTTAPATSWWGWSVLPLWRCRGGGSRRRRHATTSHLGVLSTVPRTAVAHQCPWLPGLGTLGTGPDRAGVAWWRVIVHLEVAMNTGRALLGVAFVSLGTLLLLQQTGTLDAGRVIADWWPVLLLVAATLELLARPPRPVAASVLGAIGLVLLAGTTDLVPGSVLALVWPLGIILLGAWLLLRRGPVAVGGASDDAVVDATVLFSGRRIVGTSPRFRGGSVTAVFGGIELDLTGAEIPDGAVLDAVAVFGGVELTVPLGWRVVVDGPAIFGGHENNVPAPADAAAPTLRVRATAIFGGVEVGAGAGWPAATPT